MKIVLGILLGLACGVLIWLLVESSSATRSDPPVPALAPEHDGARLADLERKVASLESEMQRLGFQVAQHEGPSRSAGTSTFVATPADTTRAGDGLDPRWYLEQYARSFDAGGTGSEYFRLAVDAYAPQLLREICDIVRDGAAHAELRSRLALMLGTPRFALNALAIDTLVAMLRGASADVLAFAALDALKPIGDAQTGITLERSIWSLASFEVQKRALALIMELDGPDANRALERLFAAATTTEARALVIQALSTGDPDAALDVFRQASTAEDAVRLQAALAIHKFRGESFIAFIDQWLGYERDPHVRQILGEARARMDQVQPYAAQKAAGPPDAEPNQDHPNAWASQSPDMGVQWLDLGYKTARRASGVRIHEVNVAGAVVQVFLFDESGARHEVWSGSDPTRTPGVFEISFATTSYRVRAVRIVLDTNLSPGWSEIDAVQLVGPDGNAWATDASASSSYGQ